MMRYHDRSTKAELKVCTSFHDSVSLSTDLDDQDGYNVHLSADAVAALIGQLTTWQDDYLQRTRPQQ